MSKAPTRPLAELERELAARKRKPFARPWLDLGALPPLSAAGGPALSRAAVEHVCAEQSRAKAMAAADAIAPWLLVVDRAGSGDFAKALLEQWLASAQEAQDRWALCLAGLLGDERVITALSPWIAKWCEGARHKLAEHAAQAIALLGGDQALMALDALRTRYRTKFRNVGAAANAAFSAAAAARGISADELGDLVMPALGFAADGLRRFEWAGGGAGAELGVDWKLAWRSLDGDKRWKSLPAAAPAEVALEVKELGKQLREATKAQAQRLEQALVRQRRWDTARFEELFLRHPLGRTFASRLVLGVYGEDGRLLRCCRRYENGILADAKGSLEELGAGCKALGFVHPLELGDAELAEWRAHLQRARVTPPFQQLDRPVLRLPAGHENRRELATAQGRSLSAGTFRGRAERRGFNRGSVTDAGGVGTYWKDFPGCGIEVVLELEGMYMGIDPMAQVTLGTARFVRGDSVRRGSYVYDDPTAGDPRVVAFGAVPAVVYSETLGDLEAIVGERS